MPQIQISEFKLKAAARTTVVSETTRETAVPRSLPFPGPCQTLLRTGIMMYINERKARVDLLLGPPSGCTDSTRSAPWIRRLLFASLIALWTVLLLLLQWLGGNSLSLASSLIFPVRWRSASSRAVGIKWFPCPDSPDTFCAFFRVPLDHLNATSGQAVSLAVRKLPATVNPRDRLGTLFMNPGGPGGSGTEALARQGHDISSITGGRYDIVSWDPRGVNMTTPGFGCFSDEALATMYQKDEEALGLRYQAEPTASLDTTSLPISRGEVLWAARLDAMGIALDETCRRSGNHDMLTHASTSISARDMRALMVAVGDRTLNYWGFSYGTVLGATFCAMFPDEVNRVVLDGVSDPETYTNNFWNWGRAAMNHTSKTYDGFLGSCAEAGPTRCALAKANETAGDLKDRINRMRIQLHGKPISVSSFSTSVGDYLGAGIVTTSAVQHAIFRSLYNPKRWPDLALALADLERGNGTRIYASLNGGGALPLTDPLDNPFHHYMERVGSGLSTHAIACSDTDIEALSDKSPETLIKYMREMGEKSISGEAWSLWIAHCRHWKFRAKETYRGPWTIEQGLSKPRFPLLIVGNTADPVTPLSSAIKTAEGWGRESASLLIQNGYGHCTYSQPSSCTSKVIGDYFVNGTVPKWGTQCDSDPSSLFPSLPGYTREEYTTM